MNKLQKSADEYKQRMRVIAEKQRLDRKQKIKQGENMSYELDFSDEMYDTGYGEIGGDLIVEVEAIIEDTSFDAYNAAGVLETFGGDSVVGFKVLGATFFGIGNNGVELGEYTFDSLSELQSEFGISEDTILEMVQGQVDRDLY